MSLAAVRVRASVHVRGGIRDTLRMLRLTRTNHCVLLPAQDPVRGMLQKAKDYVTWGEVREEVLAQLLAHRGRLRGGRPLTEAELKARGYGSFQELAQALVAGEVRLQDLQGVKPVFRLHPPRKGYGGIKRAFVEGGALGDRGDAINDLIQRMLG